MHKYLYGLLHKLTQNFCIILVFYGRRIAKLWAMQTTVIAEVMVLIHCSECAKHAYTCACVCVHVCVYVCVCVCVCACAHVCAYIHACVSKALCMCLCGQMALMPTTCCICYSGSFGIH